MLIDKRHIAEDVDTPAATLVELLGDANLWVRKAAAANPSTPMDALELFLRAGVRDDFTGYASPDATLSPRELEPLAAGGEWARCLVARHPAATAGQLQRLAADAAAAVRLEVARHHAAPTQAIARLMLDDAAAVRDIAANHPAASPQVRTIIDRAARGGCLLAAEQDALLAAGSWARSLVARNPFTDRAVLCDLANDASWRVRAAIAENPDAPGEALRPLLGVDRADVRVALASHPHTPPDVLAALVEDMDASVRVAVAAHRLAGGTALARLAEDGVVAVRSNVAANPVTPADVITRLVAAGSTPDLLGFGRPDTSLDEAALAALADGGPWARQLAVRHPGTPPEALARLACDAHFLVRDAVTHHPRRPRDVIALLVKLGSTDDLQAYERPTAPATAGELQRAADLGPWGRQLAARHPDANAALLTSLHGDPDWQVRRAIALHAHAPADLLLQLTTDPAADVRWALLKRKALPDVAWARLVEDSEPGVRDAALRDARCPRALREDTPPAWRSAVPVAVRRQ